jgi:hypothetical protein
MAQFNMACGVCRRTALSLACENRQVEMVVAFMEAGARDTRNEIDALHRALIRCGDHARRSILNKSEHTTSFRRLCPDANAAASTEDEVQRHGRPQSRSGTASVQVGGRGQDESSSTAACGREKAVSGASTPRIRQRLASSSFGMLNALLNKPQPSGPAAPTAKRNATALQQSSSDSRANDVLPRHGLAGPARTPSDSSAARASWGDSRGRGTTGAATQANASSELSASTVMQETDKGNALDIAAADENRKATGLLEQIAERGPPAAEISLDEGPPGFSGSTKAPRTSAASGFHVDTGWLAADEYSSGEDAPFSDLGTTNVSNTLLDQGHGRFAQRPRPSDCSSSDLPDYPGRMEHPEGSNAAHDRNSQACQHELERGGACGKPVRRPGTSKPSRSARERAASYLVLVATVWSLLTVVCVVAVCGRCGW